MQTADRILQYIDYKGISKRTFYQKTGLSNGYLTKVKDVGSSKLEVIISEYPDLNLNWLITGEGQMLGKNEVLDFPAGERIPLVGESAAAGWESSAFSISNKDVLDYYIMPKLKGVDFLIEISGESMLPLYRTGDIVGCRIIKEDSFIQWGRIHLVATAQQGILLKRLKPGSKDGALQMVSENKEYPPFDVPREEITGIALVVGGVRFE